MSKNISFVTEAQIEEKRKIRQEEWEKTRKEDDPLEAPEEKYDPRTLYERLQEQKMMKQEAFEESKKLKNLIKGLDNDEIEFLQAIDNSRAEAESQKYQEEMFAIDEYKRQVTNLTVEEQEKRLLDFKRELFQQHKKNQDNSKRKPTQAELLSKAIKRKVVVDETLSKSGDKKTKVVHEQSASSSSTSLSSKEEKKYVPKPNTPTLQCIGILPGIGFYNDTSDEDDCEDFQLFPDPKEQD